MGMTGAIVSSTYDPTSKTSESDITAIVLANPVNGGSVVDGSHNSVSIRFHNDFEKQVHFNLHTAMIINKAPWLNSSWAIEIPSLPTSTFVSLQILNFRFRLKTKLKKLPSTNEAINHMRLEKEVKHPKNYLISKINRMDISAPINHRGIN